jgi:hypothetical protein
MPPQREAPRASLGGRLKRADWGLRVAPQKEGIWDSRTRRQTNVCSRTATKAALLAEALAKSLSELRDSTMYHAHHCSDAQRRLKPVVE